MTSAPLLNATLCAALALMAGWLLWAGRDVFIPIVAAVIVAYVLSTATEALRRLPVVGRLPPLLLKLLVLVAFTAVALLLAMSVTVAVRQLIARAPAYQANLEAMLEGFATKLGQPWLTSWADVRAATIAQMNLRAYLLGALGGLTSLGATLVLVLVYAAFLMGEQRVFGAKLAAAFDNPAHASRAQATFAEASRRIGDYLVAKTLVNVVLGVLSYLVLLFLGVDFALLFAVVIGLANYIPYVGTFIGMAFPVLLAIVQFGSLGSALGVAAPLALAQFYVGFVLEPRVIGRQVDLSPFVVLLALSFWSLLWGVPGAVLAVPLTSVVAIVLQQVPATRFLAVMMGNGAARDASR